jgi:FG-GAP repeat
MAGIRSAVALGRRASVLALAAFAALAAAAPAQLDVRFDAAGRIDGAAAVDLAGLGAAGAGDVNGDRIPDSIVGASGADNRGRRESGSAYVVFGRRGGGRVDLKRLGRRGFRIDGAERGDHAGLSVAGVGDMNRDGLADVAVAALDANASGRRDSGAAYVVFGKRGSRGVDLAKLGRRGFRVVPGPKESYVGELAAAGDVNGDRRADLVIGAELEGGGSRRSGWAWVVFGKRGTDTVNLNRLGRNGLLIEGPAERVETKAVGGAGDFNRDGRADVIVGAPRADVGGREGAGLAYVVLGRRRGGTIDLTERGARALRLEGAGTRHSTGAGVSGGRDLNGDRRSDVVVGAPGASPRGRRQSGSAYVVFGRRRPGRLELGELGSAGFRIDGARPGDRAGDAVGLSADTSGDRLADVLVGASRADAGGLRDAGSAYLVFGKATSGGIDTRELAAGDGLSFDGGAADDSAGVSLAGAGDVNGDRLGDVLIGAFGTTSFGRESSGAAYLFLGRAP